MTPVVKPVRQTDEDEPYSVLGLGLASFNPKPETDEPYHERTSRIVSAPYRFSMKALMAYV